MGVVNADFSKIETRKKALYVRKKGIPEGGLKPLQTKGFGKGKIGTVNHSLFLFLERVTLTNFVILQDPVFILLFSSRTTQKLADYCLGTPSLFKKMGCVVPNYFQIISKSFGIAILKGSIILEITLPFVLIIVTLKKGIIRRK